MKLLFVRPGLRKLITAPPAASQPTRFGSVTFFSGSFRSVPAGMIERQRCWTWANEYWCVCVNVCACANLTMPVVGCVLIVCC